MIISVEKYLTKNIRNMLLCITWPSKLKYWSSCLVVPQYNNIAVQQGMRAGQLLLDWLMPAERNWLTSCAVALCREVQCVRTVDRKNTQWKNYELRDQINCMVISLPSSPWPLKDTYHSHLGWGSDFLGFLIITCPILPHDLWKIQYISLPFRVGGVLGGYPDGSSSRHARFFP